LDVELADDEGHKVSMVQTFVVIDELSAYNAFLGRPTLTGFKIALAPWCLMMKFPTESGVGVIKGDPITSRDCYMNELRENRRKELGKNTNTGGSLRIREPAS